MCLSKSTTGNVLRMIRLILITYHAQPQNLLLGSFLLDHRNDRTEIGACPCKDLMRRSSFVLIERLSMTLRQTANGKNETFAVRFQLSVQ